MSLNFVLDASLVPETCPLQFDDSLSAETEPGFAVKVGNLLFPAFVRPARWEFHQLPQVHPANGTGAPFDDFSKLDALFWSSQRLS